MTQMLSCALATRFSSTGISYSSDPVNYFASWKFSLSAFLSAESCFYLIKRNYDSLDSLATTKPFLRNCFRLLLKMATTKDGFPSISFDSLLKFSIKTLLWTSLP